MTMLEKMARAMVDAQGDDYDALPEIGRRNAQNECRAALLAIREPTPEMCRAAEQAGADAVNAADEWAAHDCNIHESQPPAMHRAMIDAILNEEKAPPAP